MSSSYTPLLRNNEGKAALLEDVEYSAALLLVKHGQTLANIFLPFQQVSLHQNKIMGSGQLLLFMIIEILQNS